MAANKEGGGGGGTVVLPSEAEGTVLDSVAVSDGFGQVVGDERLRDDLGLEIPDLNSVADSGAQPDGGVLEMPRD